MMTAEQLKGSILQLAMQGKLVEQRTSERVVVFKKGKGKETEELDFEIPMTWITAHLETVVDLVPSKQYQIKESEVKPEGEYHVISQSKEYSIGYCNDKSKLYHHSQPVIVFGDHTTEVKFIDFDFVVGADGIKIFNPNTGIIETRFLYYQLQFYTRGLNKVGGYSRHYKFIKNKPIVIPPLAEQKRIVAKIEELMPFVEQYAATSMKLNTLNASFPEMMKKSILQEAVQGKLVPQDPNDEPASLLLKKIAEEKKRLIKEGKIKKQKPLPEITEDEIPFDIPESWEWVRFAQVVNIESNLVKPEDHQEKLQIAPDCIGKGNGVLLQKRTVKESGVKSPNHLFFKGQIIYSKIRPALRKAVEAPSDGLCSADMYPLSTIMDNHYTLYYILSDTFTNAVTANANRVKMPKVNQEELNNVLIPVPPLSEQRRIAKRLDILIPQLGQLFEKTHS